MADARISYTDDNSLEVILNGVIKNFETEIQSNGTLNDDGKRHACAKFAQSFRRTMWDNVFYKGDPLQLKDSPDRRIEVKGDEEEQMEYYNTVLYPEMNSLTVEVTKKRKTYPVECCNNLRTTYDTELIETKSSTETATNNMLSHVKNPVSEFKLAEMLTLTEKTALDMSTFDTKADVLIDKAKRLKIVRCQARQNKSVNETD